MKIMKLLKKKIISLVCVVTVLTTILITAIAFENKKEKTNVYNIECDVCKNELSGKLQLNYYNNNGFKVRDLYFCLYPNAFKNESNVLNVAVEEKMTEAYPNGFDSGYISVNSVKVNNQNIDYYLEENEQILHITDLNIQKNRFAKIQIEFFEKTPDSPTRFGYNDDTYNYGNWYPVLCPFENGEAVKCVYTANGDPFYSEIANYNVKIKTDSTMRIATTGIINAKNSSDLSKTVWDISAEKVRDFAFVMSEKYDLLSETVGDTIVYSYYYSDYEQGKQALDNGVEAVKFFSSLFGKYPYSTYSIAEADFYIGGMEYPNLVYISDELYSEQEALEEVVVHETAHQWWYGIVGNNEINEAWLDEGLTEYSVGLFLEDKYGEQRYKMFIRENEGYCRTVLNFAEQINENADKKIAKPSNQFENWLVYDALTYDGVSIMLDGLRATVGKERFILGLKNYFEKEKYAVSTRDKFIASFSDGCGYDISDFITPWLDGKIYWG